MARWLDIGGFMDLDSVSGKYPAILIRQTFLIENLLYHGKRTIFSYGKAGNQRWRHLAHSGSQSQLRIRIILPAQVVGYNQKCNSKCNCNAMQFQIWNMKYYWILKYEIAFTKLIDKALHWYQRGYGFGSCSSPAKPLSPSLEKSPGYQQEVIL